MKNLVSNLLFFMMLLSCIVSEPLFAQEKSSQSEHIFIEQRTPDEKSDAESGKIHQTVVIAPSQNAAYDVAGGKPIKIVYPFVMPPYTFKDDTGQAQGLAVDLLHLWSKKTGIPIRFTSAPWDKGLEMMRDGKADIHASLYYTEERDSYMDYAAVIASSEGSIFFHKNIIDLSDPEDLRAYRVGAVRGGYHEQYVQEHLPKVPLISYAEFPEMLMAAQKGDVRVFIEDVGATIYRLKQRGLLDEFRYNPGHPLYRNNFWIAVRQGDTELAQALKQGMALISPEERATIERKWMGTSAVKTQDTLFIAMYNDFAPLTFLNAEGRPAGLFVDIWKLWAEKTGEKIEFLANNWKGSLDSLKQGGADIHSGLFYSDARAQLFDYSQSFYESGSCFFYSNKQKEPYKKGIYAGKKVGVIKGSYHEEHLQKEHPTVDVILFEGTEKMLRAVLNGEISACLTEYSSATDLINRLGLSGMFSIEDPMHFTQKFYAGVLKKNNELLALINDGFASMTTNELADIEQRWVPDQEKRYYKHPAQEISLTEEEKAWLAQDHTVRVRVEEYPPNYFERDGKPFGIAIDLLNLISKRTGIKFRFIIPSPPFSDDLVGLINHAGPDVLPSLQKNPEREKNILFTKPYVTSPRFIFTRDDAPFVASLEDLSGKTVAVEKGFLVDEWLADSYPGIKVLPCQNTKKALALVSSGKVFAYVGPLRPASTLINIYGFRNLKAASPTSLPDGIASMGIRNDWPELQTIFNKSFDLIPEAEKNAIINKWSTVKFDYGIRPGDIIKWVLIVAGGGMLIILMFVAWNRTLNRRVKARTFELAESEERFRATFEQAAVGIAHISPEGRFLRINQKFCDIVGYSHDEMLKLAFQDITYPDDLNTDLENVQQLLNGKSDVYNKEKRYISKNDKIVWINLTVSLLRDDKGKPNYFVSVVREISSRKEIEAELTLSEERYRALFEQSQNGILFADVYTGKFRYANPAAGRLFGYSPDELCTMGVVDIYPPDYMDQVKREFDTQDHDEKKFGGGLPFIKKDGSIFYANINVTRLQTAEGDFSVGFLTDVTNRKQAEEKIQEYQKRLKALATQLTIAEEDERRRIASELHDHIGQTLAFVRIQIANARKFATEEKQIGILDEIYQSLLKTIQNTKDLVFDLSSPLLNEIGLAAAISNWLEEQVWRKYGIKTEFIGEFKKLEISDDSRTILFRNVRELLANVIKHAQAANVSVFLEKNAAELKIIIQDDGIGFDPDQQFSKEIIKQGFGLFSIKERMADFGGFLEIVSSPGMGCKATLSAPFNLNDSEYNE